MALRNQFLLIYIIRKRGFFLCAHIKKKEMKLWSCMKDSSNKLHMGAQCHTRFSFCVHMVLHLNKCIHMLFRKAFFMVNELVLNVVEYCYALLVMHIFIRHRTLPILNFPVKTNNILLNLYHF